MDEVKKVLREIVGPENVMDSKLDLFTYSYDGSTAPLLPAQLPDVAVRVKTVEQVSKVLALANARSIQLFQEEQPAIAPGGQCP